LKIILTFLITHYFIILYYNGDWGWGLGIGDWGLGIGDWAQSPIPNPQSPIPNPHYINKIILKNYKINYQSKIN